LLETKLARSICSLCMPSPSQRISPSAHSRRFVVPSKSKKLSPSEIAAFEAKRDIGSEILQSRQRHEGWQRQGCGLLGYRSTRGHRPVTVPVRQLAGSVRSHTPRLGARTKAAKRRSAHPPCNSSHQSEGGSGSLSAVRLNPSLKLRPNGVPPGPRCRAVHHRHRGPGGTPSVPA